MPRPLSDAKRVAGIEAMLKEAKGEETLTSADRAAIKLYRKHLVAELRTEMLSSIPKGVYCELSGRKHWVVDEQAKRYGLPISGAEIDLYAVLAAFHDLIAKHHRQLSVDDDELNLKQEKIKGEIAVLERRARIMDGEIRQQRSQWVARADVHRRLKWLVSRIQAMSEEIGRAYGAEPQRFIGDWLEDMAVEIEGGRLDVGHSEAVADGR